MEQESLEPIMLLQHVPQLRMSQRGKTFHFLAFPLAYDQIPITKYLSNKSVNIIKKYNLNNTTRLYL